MSPHDVIWNEVIKAGVCLDCGHSECLAIADAAKTLTDLLKAAR